MIKLIVHGKIQGKGRHRVNTRSGKCFTPESTRNYEQYIKLSYLQKYGQPILLEGALRAELKAYYEIPKSTSKKQQQLMLEGKVRPTTKPDADNILKLALDALNSLAYKDDKQVVEANVNKYYAKEPFLSIKIEKLLV